MKDERRIKFIIISITLAFLVLALTNFVLSGFLYRFSNDDCVWVGFNHEGLTAFYIRNINPGGAVDKAGILTNDILLKINGRTFDSANDAQLYINQFKKDDVVTYTISRDGKVFDVDVTLTKLSNTQVIIQFIVALAFLFVGFMVVYNNPFQYISRFFFYFMFVFFMFLTFSRIPPRDIFMGQFLGVIRLVFTALLGPAVLHFFMIFPRKWSFLKKHRWLIFLIYLPSIGLVFLNRPLNLPNLVLNSMMGLYMASASISFFLLCSKIENKEDRRPLKIIKWGLLLGLIPLASMIYLNQYMIQILGLRILYFAFGMMILIPLSFGYSVMKYGLMDVSFVIKKSLIYSMITITFVVFYILMVVGLGSSWLRESSIFW